METEWTDYRRRKWRRQSIKSTRLIPMVSVSMTNTNAFMLLTSGIDRIVEWKFGAKMGEVVAGGNGRGNRMDQLSEPNKRSCG